MIFLLRPYRYKFLLFRIVRMINTLKQDYHKHFLSDWFVNGSFILFYNITNNFGQLISFFVGNIACKAETRDV